VLVGCGALALVAANFLTLAGYMLVQPLAGWRASQRSLDHNPFFLLVLQSIFHGLVLGVIYLFLVVNHGLPFWASLKWRRPTVRMAQRYFPGGVALALLIQFAPPLLPDRDDFPLQRLFSSPEAGYAIAVFAILVAPFMEELIFRGVFFTFFEHLVGWRFAIGGSALLFAALHVPEYWGAWNHVFLITIVGLAFSLARGLTGSLTPCYILHVAYNATLIAGLYSQTQGFRTFSALLPL
jgi:membrane protease YdiL (CAAX protease family)